MATYVFGGGPVQPSSVSYISINLNQNITLNWPISYLDTINVLGQVTDVIPDAGGRVLTLPDARFVAPGTSFLMNNRSAHAFTLNRNDGSLLQNFAAGNILFFYLIDTTTAAGTWITTPFGGGVAAVTSVNAVSSSPATLTIGGAPIVDAGTITFTPGAELVGLQALGGFGYVVRTGVGTYASRTFGVGAGGNIVFTNANGVGGNTTIALATTVAGLVSLTSTQVQAGNLQLLGNAITATNLNGDVALVPNGIGSPRLGLLGYPTNDIGRVGYVPISRGTNLLSLGRIAANNLIINGAFQIWSTGNLFTVANGNTYTADRWQLLSTGNVVATVIRPNAPNEFSVSFGRQVADAHAGTVTFGQTMLISTCIGAAKEGFVSFSFIASAGAGFSSTTLNTLFVDLITGTGTVDGSALSSAFTGVVTQTTNVVLTNAPTLYTYTLNVANNVTQIALSFRYNTPAVAALNDYVILSQVQMNLGPTASAFEFLDASTVENQCKFYSYGDFLYGTKPVTGIGANTGETTLIATQAGAGVSPSTTITHPVLRAVPTTFVYNPVSNNGLFRDITLGQDCSGAPTIASDTDRSFRITTPGATAGGGTVAGNVLGIHYFRDAELY